MSRETSKYVIFLLSAFTQLFTGCNKYIFIPDGTIINADDRYYVNDSLKLSIYVPGDYYIYNHQLKRGVKVDKLYAQDKRILTHLNLKPQQVNLLFTAVPVIEPYFHLIAFFRNSNDTDLKGYETKYQNDTLLYYYRRLKTDKFEIGETLLPYHKNYIEFLHYNTLINDCEYCDLDEISMINSRRILQGSELSFDGLWQGHADSNKYKPTLINIPYPHVLKSKAGLIMAYKLNSKQNTRELVNFKFLKPCVDHMQINLSAGDYLIQYTDLNHKLKWSEHFSIE